MSQLPLLAFRKQPVQAEAELPNRVISAYVKGALEGFPARQAAREQRRKAKSKRRKAAEQKVTMPTLFDMLEENA